VIFIRALLQILDGGDRPLDPDLGSIYSERVIGWTATTWLIEGERWILRTIRRMN
jgi:hypothetical protein